MNDYERGQRDLISYIKAHIIHITQTSKGDDLILDVANLLRNLKPLKDIKDQDRLNQTTLKNLEDIGILNTKGSVTKKL